MTNHDFVLLTSREEKREGLVSEGLFIIAAILHVYRTRTNLSWGSSVPQHEMKWGMSFINKLQSLANHCVISRITRSYYAVTQK